VSPNQVFPSDSGPLNPIAARVLEDPNLTYDVSADSIVIAVKRELLVRKSIRKSSPALDQALAAIARNCGTLAQVPRAKPTDGVSRIDGGGPFGDVEIWRIDESQIRAGMNSIDEARRLRALADDQDVGTYKGSALPLPAVSPHHVAILSPAAGGCPAGPPHPARHPDWSFIEPVRDRPRPRIAVLDSGYIYTHPPHRLLDERVRRERGEWLDTATDPASWRPDRQDGLYTDSQGRLDGISGHGTFIAGLIAHACPHAELTIVSLRNQEVEIDGLNPAEQTGLYETEAAIAHAMLLYSDVDVIQCGFAFPTLDDYPSLPFAAAMQVLVGENTPRRGVAVVAPAGNEGSPNPYWPAALPDVIGVASTDRDGDARAKFSNWGPWCDGCTRGEHVFSTFVYWDGPIEGEAGKQNFSGWATWDGTSFAAPKVSAAIACMLAHGDEAILPVEAWQLLVSGDTPVRVTPLTDLTLTPSPGVTLPHLHLG
jgi:Subtilase family